MCVVLIVLGGTARIGLSDSADAGAGRWDDDDVDDDGQRAERNGQPAVAARPLGQLAPVAQ